MYYANYEVYSSEHFYASQRLYFFQYTISEQNEFLRNCTSPQFPCNSDLFSFYETSCIYCSYLYSLIYSPSFRYHPTISIIYRTFSPFMFSVMTKRVGFNPFVSYLFFFVNSSLFFLTDQGFDLQGLFFINLELHYPSHSNDSPSSLTNRHTLLLFPGPHLHPHQENAKHSILLPVCSVPLFHNHLHFLRLFSV